MSRSIEDITLDLYEAKEHMKVIKLLIEALSKEQAEYITAVYKKEIVCGASAEAEGRSNRVPTESRPRFRIKGAHGLEFHKKKGSLKPVV